MSRLLIFGSGGHAKVVISTARAASMEVIAAVDEAEEKWGGECLGVPICGPADRLVEEGIPWVIAIGDNAVRKRMAASIDGEFAIVVHPEAWIDPTATLGPGTVVFAGAVVQPNVRIGSHCILNTRSSIDHDGICEDFAQIAPGATLGGNVTMQEGSMVGIGASVHQGATIGADSVVGGGAFFKGELPHGRMALGVPAKDVGPVR